jgi:hypothetical protein
VRHSKECAALPKDRLMWQLTEAQRRAVLACPHRAHDSVRFLWGAR